MRIALGIEYDGGAFSGYQYQAHAPSVQGTLQDALSRVAAAPIVLTSRADSAESKLASVALAVYVADVKREVRFKLGTVHY